MIFSRHYTPPNKVPLFSPVDFSFFFFLLFPTCLFLSSSFKGLCAETRQLSLTKIKICLPNTVIYITRPANINTRQTACGEQRPYSFCVDAKFIAQFWRNLEVKSTTFPWNTWLGLRFNPLNTTGHVMHQQFNIQQLYVLPTLYLCVLYLSENKQRLVPLTA